jgi:hypothetical protein
MDIIGYEGLYKIHYDGRIWGCTSKKFKKTRLINGYEYITLCKDGKRKTISIHRLLVQHFKPEEWNPELHVDHINGIRTDNRLENLRMVTSQQNSQNQGVYKTNTSGHKNISYNKQHKLWYFQKVIAGNVYQKTFKTLDEALEFKKVFCVIHNVIDFRK